jgi:hypothetical protein
MRNEINVSKSSTLRDFCASKPIRRGPSMPTDRQDLAIPLLLQACTERTPQHNELHTTSAHHWARESQHTCDGRKSPLAQALLRSCITRRFLGQTLTKLDKKGILNQNYQHHCIRIKLGTRLWTTTKVGKPRLKGNKMGGPRFYLFPFPFLPCWHTERAHLALWNTRPKKSIRGSQPHHFSL